MRPFTTDNLRFNFGFLLDGPLGQHTRVELEYPTVKLEEVYLSPLTGYFKASRTTQGVYLKGKLTSIMQVACSRCTDDYPHELSMQLDDHYYVANSAPDGEYIIREDGILDLGPLVREISLVSVPMQPICKAACRGLCVECGQNLNQVNCDCETDDIDPRMAVLKQLLESQKD